MYFKKLDALNLNENTFKLINGDWMLISAKDGEKTNAMTASWGGFGVLWHKNVAFIFVRPERYTKEFLDSSPYFTLSFFKEDKREELQYLGKVSGRDEDKIGKTSLTKMIDDDFVYFDEAKLVIKCRKLYTQKLSEECLVDKSLVEFYKSHDYHYLYVGEIVEIMEKEV
jgi:flavin reductase (DIM6/NTAB) family NADH-FMN oxidoreductase RutF